MSDSDGSTVAPASVEELRALFRDRSRLARIANGANFVLAVVLFAVDPSLSALVAGAGALVSSLRIAVDCARRPDRDLVAVVDDHGGGPIGRSLLTGIGVVTTAVLVGALPPLIGFFLALLVGALVAALLVLGLPALGRVIGRLWQG